MPGLHKSRSELERAILLRASGYSLAAIADKTAISPSTLARHFAKHRVSKGKISDEAIAEAKQQLLSDAGFVNGLKHEIAAAVLDDISHVKQLREAAALLLEQMMNDTSLPAHYKTRGLAALSTSLRLTQESIRKALRVDELVPESSELPQLTILELSQEDIEQLRHSQTKDSAFDVPDIEEIEIISEDD